MKKIINIIIMFAVTIACIGIVATISQNKVKIKKDNYIIDLNGLELTIVNPAEVTPDLDNYIIGGLAETEGTYSAYYNDISQLSDTNKIKQIMNNLLKFSIYYDLRNKVNDDGFHFKLFNTNDYTETSYNNTNLTESQYKTIFDNDYIDILYNSSGLWYLEYKKDSDGGEYFSFYFDLSAEWVPNTPKPGNISSSRLTQLIFWYDNTTRENELYIMKSYTTLYYGGPTTRLLPATIIYPTYTIDTNIVWSLLPMVILTMAGVVIFKLIKFNKNDN